MRDLKRKGATVKVRSNRRKKQKKPVDLRRLLHRSLRITVSIGSVILIVAGSFFLVQLLMASDQFRIDNIVVKGHQRLHQETIVALSDVQPGVSTFSLDLGLIGRKISENPWVEKARIERVFPRQVVITVTERIPVAIVNLGYLYYMDAGGEVFKVLDVSDSLDYPVVTGFDLSRLEQGDVRDRQGLQTVVGLIAELGRREGVNLGQVSEIHREAGGGLSLYTLVGGVRIRLGNGDYARKLDRLERIYPLLQPKMQMLDYIDLNVDEKVIVRIERSAKAAKS